MRSFLILVFILIVSVMVGDVVLAQPPGLPATPDQAPIDGGLALLAAAGGGYALKKLRDRNRNA